MNVKKFTVIGLAALALLFFYLGMNAYKNRAQTAQDVQVKAEQTRLVRMYSPVFGPQAAPVTIVEFFDPACETCRAFYPIVKDLMARYPNDVSQPGQTTANQASRPRSRWLNSLVWTSPRRGRILRGPTYRHC